MRKAPVDAAAALALARRARHIYSKAGRALRHFDAAAEGPPTADDVATLLLGRAGALRAPVLQVGDTLVAGWDEALYARLLL